MIAIEGTINNRRIYYLDIKQDLEEFGHTELKNWVLFVIEDNIKNPVLVQFADLCIDKDVLYACAAGKACSEIDDLFDWQMIERVRDGGRLPTWYLSDEEDVLMTTWHHNFEEGYWYVLNVASYEDLIIDTVVVINLTEDNYLPKIQDLTTKISNGWMPED